MDEDTEEQEVTTPVVVIVESEEDITHTPDNDWNCGKETCVCQVYEGRTAF